MRLLAVARRKDELDSFVRVMARVNVRADDAIAVRDDLMFMGKRERKKVGVISVRAAYSYK